MTYYEFTLVATVRRKIVQAGADYDEALQRALAKFDLTAAQADPEVEMFHVLDDDEVVRLRESGVAI